MALGTPQDVQAIAHDVLRHRLILSYEAHAEGVAADKVIDKIIELVAVALGQCNGAVARSVAPLKRYPPSAFGANG